MKSEIQQFMVDTLFPISSTTPSQNPSAASHRVAGGAEEFINPYNNSYPHQSTYNPPPPPVAMQFSHFHSFPISQQLFTMLPHPHHHQHYFQLFHTNPHYEHHRRLQPIPPLLDHAPPFLAVDDSSCSGSKEGLNDENNFTNGIFHSNDASESRLRPWHREEDCDIKEPFWRPLDLDCINRNNKPQFAKQSHEAGGIEISQSDPTAAGSYYKLFSELDAIYRPGGSCTATGNITINKSTGSGSALTGDDRSLMPTIAAGAHDPDSFLDDNNFTGGEAHPNLRKGIQKSRRRCHRRRQVQMESIAAFFEGLVKQLMDHQEALHQKFLDAMEQSDRERAGLEETRREQEEVLRASRDAHDRALIVAREAAIIPFLERITGETLNLPANFYAKKDNADGTITTTMMRASRWPKSEVQALIRVRSGLEWRFQEPGRLKGPLWEEVSVAMAAIGYQRSSKRCKEKWENINKYFRKAKDGGRKRSKNSKTCPYFQQLDKLYSNSDQLEGAVVGEKLVETEEQQSNRHG